METREPLADLGWDQVRESLLPWMRADNRTNLYYIGRVYLGLAALLAIGTAVLQNWRVGLIPTPAMIVVSTIVAFGVAVLQHHLSGLAHEASHYVLLKNRLANELVSDLLLLFPIVAFTQKYREAHLGHHQFVNDPLHDPDLLRLNHPKPQAFPLSKLGFWRRYIFAPLWPPTLLAYLFGRARAANLQTGGRAIRSIYSTRVARTMRGTYWLSLLALVHLSGNWTSFWLLWVLPLLTFYPFLMQLREVAHHSNAPDDGDFTNSRVFVVHPILKFCIFPYGQDFHLTHHLFALIPHYRIAQTHELLLRYAPYREQVITCRGYFFHRRGASEPCLLDLLSQPIRNWHRGDPMPVKGMHTSSPGWNNASAAESSTERTAG